MKSKDIAKERLIAEQNQVLRQELEQARRDLVLKDAAIEVLTQDLETAEGRAVRYQAMAGLDNSDAERRKYLKRQMDLQKGIVE